MKRLFLVLTLVGLFTSCAFVKTQKDYASACFSDPACYSEAMTRAKDAGNKAGDIASLAPIPAVSPIAKTVVGYGALIFFLCVLGKKLKKEPV